MTKGAIKPATQSGASNGFIASACTTRYCTGEPVKLVWWSAWNRITARNGHPCNACQTRLGAAISTANASPAQAWCVARRRRVGNSAKPNPEPSAQKAIPYLACSAMPVATPAQTSPRRSSAVAARARR